MPARVFIHRLALALGRTVSELLEQLTAHELRDWQQFDIQCGLPDVAPSGSAPSPPPSPPPPQAQTSARSS